MRQAQHFLTGAALLVTVLFAVGCFRPSIKSGAFACSDGGACPDNFTCYHNTTPPLCIQNGTDGAVFTGKGGTGGASGTGGQGGKDAGMDGGADRPCLGAVASTNCPTDAGVSGMCDPVCNSGCECFEKCSVNLSGNLTCNAPAPPPLAGLFAFCSQMNSGAAQTDNCGPGLFCMGQAGECGSRCYQFCRTDNDCQGGASCSRDAGGGNKVCDFPPVPCDPIKGVALNEQSSGCAGGVTTNESCYLASTGLNETICDCQFIRSDNAVGRFLDPCTHSRDCIGGLVCYDPTGGRQPSPVCYPVCRLPGDGGVDETRVDAGEQGCAGGSAFCMPFNPPNPTFGYCQNG